MKKIIVLGSGMVGSAMAIDLAKNHQVAVADLNQAALMQAKHKCQNLETLLLDVRDQAALGAAIQKYDLVINAVPGFLGYHTLKTIILSRKNAVDIAFFPEDALELNELARDHEVTAIVDCGVAPGMDNLILGRYDDLLELTDFECLVGGLPKVRKWPFAYKAPFSPVDVIEEYTRQARYVENGQIVTREPLTDCEYIDFEDVGTLESFNSDGLRSIIQTMSHIPNMKEKTLRYPGHVEYIKVLKESGFFDTDPIEIDGQLVRPLDFTSKILFNEWKLADKEEEITVMRVRVRGRNKAQQIEEVTWHLHDTYDPVTQTSSMARTTGYTATAAANMLLNGLFTEKGVFPPERVGKHEACFEFILSYLEERNIHYRKTSQIHPVNSVSLGKH